MPKTYWYRVYLLLLFVYFKRWEAIFRIDSFSKANGIRLGIIPLKASITNCLATRSLGGVFWLIKNLKKRI